MNARPDFPDWISPMLVKELRQGLRSRSFLISFLVLQAAMIILTFAGLLVVSDGSSAMAVSVFFWIIVGFPVLLIMPSSGMNSVSGEIKENTLELIFLSRLSARRIIFGKWLAIVAQTLLLIAAILPYLVLRYYLGGVNIVSDLVGLLWMVLASALLTAFTIGLSPHTSRAGRAIIPVAIIFGLQFIGALGVSPFFYPSTRGVMSVGATIGMWSAILFLGFLLLVSLLEFGAQKIAPAVENHSTPKRIAALAAALICGLHAAIWPSFSWLWMISALIMIPIAIGAVCEPMRLIPGLFRPFAKRGFPGRVLALVLFPGWASGCFFVFFLLVFLFLIPGGPFAYLWLSRMAGDLPEARQLWSLLMVLNIFGFFFFPAAIIQVPRRRLLPPIAMFLIIQVLCGLLALLGHLASRDYPGFEHLAAMLPTTGLFLAGATHEWSRPEIMPTLIGSSILLLATFALLLSRAIFALREVFALDSAAPDPRP